MIRGQGCQAYRNKEEHMSRTRTMPSHNFEGMNAEEIGTLVEKDIKSLARKWKYAHSKATTILIKSAATETAALYLQANHVLYFRDDQQEMRNTHQHWMIMMQEWFISTIEKKSRKKKQEGQ